MGLNPYGNGSYLVLPATEDIDLRRLFCACCVPDYYEFKLSELKAYAVPPDIYKCGYGSAGEIMLPSDEQRRAS